MGDVRASAPGRVNLIGEHTDYHDGYVMPSAMPQRTTVILRPGNDRRVRARSARVDSRPVEYELGTERRSGTWGDYVQAVTWVLAEAGFTLTGFTLGIDSDIPIGSGLSSSASLAIATLRALRDGFELDLSDVALARLAQRAEVEFVGAPVGIMDQMACSLATEGEALFLDTRTLEYQRIPVPDTLELVVINSGIAHQHAGGNYATRRRESEDAARALGVARLRDLDLDDMERIDALPSVLARRARHVVTENVRVLEAREALLDHDLRRLGALLNASHASLRDDYEVSVPQVDLLVELAQAHPAVAGGRMTGGGFGGAVIVAARAGMGATVATDVSGAYASRSGKRPAVLLPRPSSDF